MEEKKILIADYDKKSLDSLVKLFEPFKIQIIKSMNGQAAYEKFKAEKPDLVILEAMLPKLHGFDLALRIYQETKGRVPIVIVTGLYKGPQYRNEALRSFGASDYFEKPFDKDKLVDSVWNLLYEEANIEEELPDPDLVIKNLTQMIKRPWSLSKKEKPPLQGK